MNFVMCIKIVTGVSKIRRECWNINRDSRMIVKKKGKVLKNKQPSLTPHSLIAIDIE